MNAFYEHHEHSIRASYRCFDRILLDGLIQPFQQPERVVGFFSFYRDQFPVSRKVLTDSADQFSNWVKNRSDRWDVPILDAPQGRRDEFVEPYFKKAKPDQVVAILKGREPARIMTAIGTPKENRCHLQMAQRWVVQLILSESGRFANGLRVTSNISSVSRCFFIVSSTHALTAGYSSALSLDIRCTNPTACTISF